MHQSGPTRRRIERVGCNIDILCVHDASLYVGETRLPPRVALPFVATRPPFVERAIRDVFDYDDRFLAHVCIPLHTVSRPGPRIESRVAIRTLFLSKAPARFVEGPRVDHLGSIDYNLTARVAFSVLDTNRRIQTN